MSVIKFAFVSAVSVILALTSCDNNQDRRSANKPFARTREGDHRVAILPFKNVDAVLVQQIKNGIEEKLSVNTILLPVVELPATAFYPPRQRYIADSLLRFLKAHNDGRYDKIIGITMKDISTRKDPHANWGVMGLGYCPGEACVISGFRAGKNKVSAKNYERRMITLALHEIGHTYGLEHCPEFSCLMKDAKGKMNLDDGDSFCKDCAGYLQRRGIMD